MGFFDDRFTESQKKWIRFSYEMAISLMLVMALKYSSMAHDEGASDCKIAQYKLAEVYGLEDIALSEFAFENTSPMIPVNISHNMTFLT